MAADDHRLAEERRKWHYFQTAQAPLSASLRHPSTNITGSSTLETGGMEAGFVGRRLAIFGSLGPRGRRGENVGFKSNCQKSRTRGSSQFAVH
ncbi:hypothetical protein TorRG33x02_237160, partial [Trema orientale]